MSREEELEQKISLMNKMIQDLNQRLSMTEHELEVTKYNLTKVQLSAISNDLHYSDEERQNASAALTEILESEKEKEELRTHFK